MNRVGSSESVETGMSNQQEQSMGESRNVNAGENQVETQAEGLTPAGQHDEPQPDEEPDEELKADFQKEFDRYHHSDLQGRPRVKCRGRRIDPALIRPVDSMIVENFTKLGTEEDLFLVLDNLVSAGSVVVCRRMGFQSPNPKSKKPGRPRKAREDRKVSHYRRLLSWLAQEIQRQQDGKKATKDRGTSEGC